MLRRLNLLRSECGGVDRGEPYDMELNHSLAS